MKNVVDSSINAFKDFATSTYDFFTDLKNYNLESFVDYIDDNLLNIGIMAGTVASLALLAVSAIGLLGASSAIMSTAMLVAGNISSIAGLAMGITGGLQVITGLNGTTLGGDELTNSERAGRLLSGTLNIFGGSGLMKTGIKLTGTDKNVVSKLINNVKESLLTDTKKIVSNLDDIISQIPKNKPVVVIGESMKRIDPIADKIKQAMLDVKTYNPRNFRSSLGNLSRLDLEANRSWIRYWTKLRSATVIDLGIDTSRIARSPFYGLESRSIYSNWNYSNVIKYNP